jgi:hypothetical protein
VPVTSAAEPSYFAVQTGVDSVAIRPFPRISRTCCPGLRHAIDLQLEIETERLTHALATILRLRSSRKPARGCSGLDALAEAGQAGSGCCSFCSCCRGCLCIGWLVVMEYIGGKPLRCTFVSGRAVRRARFQSSSVIQYLFRVPPSQSGRQVAHATP